jgi:hypothetical protein
VVAFVGDSLWHLVCDVYYAVLSDLVVVSDDGIFEPNKGEFGEDAFSFGEAQYLSC